MSRSSSPLNGAGPLMRRLNQVYARLWHEALSEAEITGPQYTVLALLALHGPITQGTLGGMASLDKSTAAPLLRRLGERGLVVIEQDADDRRRKLLSLTEEGRLTAERVAEAIPGVERRFLSALPEADQEVFLSLARRMVSFHGDR